MSSTQNLDVTAPRDYMRNKDAADYIGRSAKTLDKWRNTGGGPPYTQAAPGGLVLYRRSDLDDWMAAQVFTSTSHARTFRKRAEAETANRAEVKIKLSAKKAA